MLTGDGGTLTITGVPIGAVAAWEMRGGGDGVSLAITPRLAPYWARQLPGLPVADVQAALRVRLRRSANPDYDLMFSGDVAELSATRIVLHRAKECST